MDARVARTWVIICMAVWLTGMISMAIVASQNFFIIDPLLDAKPNPEFAKDIEKLGHDGARALLYYLASEQNRLYFQYWNVAQLIIGLLALWLVVKIPGADRPKWCIVAMLGIALFLTVAITPFILSGGRSIDFVPRDPPPAGLRTFGLLHATYTVFDGIQLILGILVTWWLQKTTD